MQRPLQQSLRRLCRQQCCRRLYSARAALTQHRLSETPSDPSVSTTALHKNAEGSKPLKTSSAKTKGTTQSDEPDNQLPFPRESEEPRSALNKVDTYLASLRAEGVEPTLEDLFRLSPKDIPSVKSRDYAASYMEFRDRLCRTFSKQQLRRFCQELQFDPQYSGSKRKKTEYAEAIMEKRWGWENLKEVEKRRKDATEVVMKTLPVSASQLFLLLGKDGSELLQISRDYNVHISVTPDPLSIRIEGFKASVRKLDAMIVERRKSIIDEKVDLPTGEPLPPSLLQQVSRTANAFIQNISDNGKIRITANSIQRLEAAKRLAIRAAVQIQHSITTPFTALLPPPSSALAIGDSAPTYALFPFSPQRSLPWTDTAGYTFRSRRINDWLMNHGRRASFSADLSGHKGQLVRIDGGTSSLETIINRSFGDSTGPYIFLASTGHVLVMATTQQHQSGILPPLVGSWQYRELLDWMKADNAHRVYVPCLPSPLHSATPTRERIVHRLNYCQVQNKTDSTGKQEAELNPVKVIRAEVIINRQQLEEPETSVVEPAEALDTEGSATKRDLDELLLDDQPYPEQASEGRDDMDQRPTGAIDDSSTVQPTVSVHQNPPAAAEENPALSLSENLHDAESLSDIKEHDKVLERESAPYRTISNKNASVVENGEPICYRGKELELLIALPDKPMDLKLTVLGSKETVPIREIPDLNRYFEALRTYLDNTATESSPPEPPLFIENGGDRYILDLNASIRQSTESLDVGHDNSQDLDAPSLAVLSSHHISTTTESIYDLESGQKFVNCQIACNGTPADERWLTFLEDMDLITSLGYKTKQTAPGSSLFSLDDQASDEDRQF